MKEFKKKPDWQFSPIMSAIAVAALWDFFLKDFFYYLGQVFVRSASLFYQGYFDRLYENVGRKVNLILYFPGIVCLVIFLLLPLFLPFTRYFRFNLRENYDHPAYAAVAISSSKFDTFLSDNRIFLVIFRTLPFLIMSLVATDLTLRALTSSNAIVTIETRLEIIRPYISDEDSYKLNSEFRLVNSRKKLQNLIDKIDVIASKNNLVLPATRLYGIDRLSEK